MSVFVDPTRFDPSEALPALYEACDIYCPNRPMMLARGEPFERVYRDLRARGKRLSLYSCSGPTRLLDPYAYYRLQAWDCFRLDAEGSYFWAFGDTGRGSSWNEYATEGTSYAPIFLDAGQAHGGDPRERAGSRMPRSPALDGRVAPREARRAGRCARSRGEAPRRSARARARSAGDARARMAG
ncbi:MAG: hypothetical protein FJZ90_13340 [Chloroflexi bacterium]|nr:hypothetical protein [Chloroflexota bacterium]